MGKQGSHAAFLAVARDPNGSCRDSRKAGLGWRDSRPLASSLRVPEGDLARVPKGLVVRAYQRAGLPEQRADALSAA